MRVPRLSWRGAVLVATVAAVFAVAGTEPLQAVRPVTVFGRPHPRQLRAGPGAPHTFVRPLRRRQGAALQANASAVSVTVNYSGFTAQAQAAFQYAVDIWSEQLSSSVPVVINAQFTPLGSGILGSAGPSSIVRDFSGAPRISTWYPIALANQLAGTDLCPPSTVLCQSPEDIDADFSSTFTWYFGTDGAVPSGEFDFVSVVLHELGHGLGFLGSGDVSGSPPQGSWGDDNGTGTALPFIFDRFVHDGGGRFIIDTGFFPNPSTALASELTGNDLWFSGTASQAASGGSGARLYAPSSFQRGSSFSHLDEATYPAGSPNSLMTPALSPTEAIHDPGPLVRGMFQDMGWALPCSYAVSPPAGYVFSAAGGTGAFTIATGTGCPWTVAGAPSWVTVTSATSGAGSGTVTFSAAPNTSMTSRMAQLTVAGVSVSIAENGVPCTFSVSPANDTVSARGGMRTVAITASAPDCGWAASSGASWLSMSAATGTGSGTVSYVALPNRLTPPRRGTISLAGISVSIGQPGTASSAIDFNGDGLDDAFLYNPTTGTWSLQTSASGLFTQTTTDAWAPGWTVKAADFNGDGLTDLLLYNAVNGQFFKAINLGAGQFSFFGYSWAPGWSPTIVDFNGDGLSDVFLYNATTGHWFTAITQPGVDDFLYTPGVWAPGWQVYPADFDGDGRGDLFLYNAQPMSDPNSGRWFRVMTQPDGTFGYVAGDVRWAADWSITTADFDGDGRTDLFLYDPAGRWFVVQFTESSAVYTGDLWASGWTIRAGDFDGDGRSDLFLYNAVNGQWFVATTTAPGSFVFTTGTWAPGWMVSVADFNMDTRADLLLYNPTNGTWFQVVPDASGGFAYTTGAWPAGMTVVSVPRSP